LGGGGVVVELTLMAEEQTRKRGPTIPKKKADAANPWLGQKEDIDKGGGGGDVSPAATVGKVNPPIPDRKTTEA